jgi:hypothetical protein
MMIWSKSVVLLAGLGLGSALRGSRLKDAPKPKTAAYRQVLHNFQDMQYYADFKLGGQDIAGIFDTGSFELLVRSKRCEKCAHPTPAYDYKLSTSYIKNGSVEQHVFGSGPCISMMGYENVEVGPMNAKGQAFWEIVDHNIPVLDRAKFAAIVGIGPDFAYGNSEKTLLMSYGIQEFSICLQRASGAEGFLTWGPEKKEDFVSAPVIGNHHWVTKMVDVHFGEKGGLLTGKGGACQGTGCAAIIDSGTSLIAAPGLALMQLSEQIEPIHEDCSNLDRLPDLHFYMNGEQFTLPPQAYVMRITGALMEADNIWDILFFKPKVRKLNMCMPAFMQMDMMSAHGPVWIIGMPFFRYFHTTFDRKNKQMHFVRASDSCETKPFHANATALLASKRRAEDYRPMDVSVDALVPPTLSSMLDFPFATNGEIQL